MQFKKSAMLVVSGLALSVLCGLASWVAAANASSAALQAALNRGPSPSPMPAVMAFVFGLLALIGFVMLCVGAYRALVKIDALPVAASAAATVQPVPVSE